MMHFVGCKNVLRLWRRHMNRGLMEDELDTQLTDQAGKHAEAMAAKEKELAEERSAHDKAIEERDANSADSTAKKDGAIFSLTKKLEEEKRRQEKGEVPDNRSFLAKYWMYIVPIVIFMAINGAAAPEGQ